MDALSRDTTLLDALKTTRGGGGRVAVEMLDGSTVVVSDGDLRRAVMAGRAVVGEIEADTRPTLTKQQAVESAAAVIMAGGLGTRLQPLTYDVPKSLIRVAGRSILDWTLTALRQAEIQDVWIAVNYKADQIRREVGDGSAYDVEVRYVEESEPLETAGALGLIGIDRPTVVINADLITSLNLRRVVDFHVEERATITMGMMEHVVNVPYGVAQVNGVRIGRIDEKPSLRFWCAAGITVVSPTAAALIPRGQPMSMPVLLEAVWAAAHDVVAFPVVESLFDIGTRAGLDEALLHFATSDLVDG